ncbi:hypothetical protein ACFU76_09935 [Streptomyces sp. NPDC057539]|uniref:hypothetical protein n=1 Tax=Streptomyces sp. NPDC057539 TaxID=3346159 RepID=UPI0036B0E1BF
MTALLSGPADAPGLATVELVAEPRVAALPADSPLAAGRGIGGSAVPTAETHPHPGVVYRPPGGRPARPRRARMARRCHASA